MKVCFCHKEVISKSFGPRCCSSADSRTKMTLATTLFFPMTNGGEWLLPTAAHCSPLLPTAPHCSQLLATITHRHMQCVIDNLWVLLSILPRQSHWLLKILLCCILYEEVSHHFSERGFSPSPPPPKAIIKVKEKKISQCSTTNLHFIVH